MKGISHFLKWTAAAAAVGLLLQGVKLYLESQGRTVGLELGLLGFVAVYAVALVWLGRSRSKPIAGRGSCVVRRTQDALALDPRHAPKHFGVK